ncbi:5-oxoproline transporter, DUF979 family subunit, partial [Escherichia coli]|uniref:5-oxoproline transporter, DUF979 family subunit n=1 Tax=Escherichia coli TaxID=562 RepID=UPI001125AF37
RIGTKGGQPVCEPGQPLHAGGHLLRQSRRLVDTIGWAVILPQMLAMLGGVFVVANTGESVQKVVSLFVNPDSRFMLVVIYCVSRVGWSI